MDLVVEGRAFVAGRLQACEIGVEEGRIVRVAKTIPAHAVAGARRLRVPRGFVMPGGVDAHVHLRDPGATHKEDAATGTRAALHGGTTAVLDMPNTTPPVVGREAFEAKRARFAARARVDWGLYAMVDPELRSFDLAARPVAYKAYLGATTNAGALPADRLGAAFARAAAAGRVVVVHAEHPDAMAEAAGGAAAGAQVRRPTRTDDWRSHGQARPVEAELQGIRAVAAAARTEGARRGPGVLVAHCTTAAGLRASRRAGLRAEVTPHHLLLDERALRRGPRAKVNPPLRPPAERAALWAAFAAGQATTLGSDHAPHTLGEKAASYARAPSGVPGVETRLPLLLAKVASGGLDLRVLVRAACEAPARLFGLPKGRIARGMDADLVVVEPRRAAKLQGAALHSRCGWTPFEGQRAVMPTTVLLRGAVALQDGEEVEGLRGMELRPLEAAEGQAPRPKPAPPRAPPPPPRASVRRDRG